METEVKAAALTNQFTRVELTDAELKLIGRTSSGIVEEMRKRKKALLDKAKRLLEGK